MAERVKRPVSDVETECDIYVITEKMSFKNHYPNIGCTDFYELLTELLSLILIRQL